MSTIRELQKQRRALKRAGASLAELDPAGLDSPALVDIFARLRNVVDRMQRADAGEFRVLTVGENSAGKSTLLRLLLGRHDTLPVGPGAVSAVATELRLIPVTGDPRPPVWRVITLTEEGARRRAMRLLELPRDDDRSLPELSRIEHRNAHVVREMMDAAPVLGYDRSYTKAELEQAGGSISFDTGAGSPLVERLSIELELPDHLWSLTWAGERAVVFVDMPGTRQGGPLETVIAEEMQDAAHVALMVVRLGGTLTVPVNVPPATDCILVATRLDHVDNPREAHSLRTIEESLASVLGALAGQGPPTRTVQLAAFAGPWAMREDEWVRFDPKNPGVWAQLDRKRTEEWQVASWPGPSPTQGGFEDALRHALRDGGVDRLRSLIEGLAGKDRADQDRREYRRLTRLGRELVARARELLADQEQAARRRRSPVADPRPGNELRELARSCSAEWVYDRVEWSQVGQAFHLGGRQLPAATACAPLAQIDFTALAHAAADDVSDELEAVLAEWWHHSGTAAAYPPASGTGLSDQDAQQFADLAERLLHQLAGRPVHRAERPGSQLISFREVARAREELARLLERRLIDVFQPRLQQVQHALAVAHADQDLVSVLTGPQTVLNQLDAVLLPQPGEVSDDLSSVTPRAVHV